MPQSTTPETVLDVRDLRIGFADADVVSGVSFTLQRGQCLALVGESGSGKSVTARALLGLAGPRSRVRAQRLHVLGQDVLRLSGRALRAMRGRDVGLVLQDALVALDPLRPVGREIAAALRGIPARRRRQRVWELLAAAGVPQPQRRAAQRADELSGGLRQRALIASAIALNPPVLIADEPTTALDTTVQDQILQLLLGLKQAGTGLLLISHDLAVIGRVADTVAVMRDGAIVEHGPARDVLATPTHPYTRQLLAAVPADRPRGTRLSDRPGPPADAVPRPLNDVALLSAAALTKRYALPDGSHHLAVDDVSFTLHRGRTLGLVGESGSGKTTTARIVLGLTRPDTGEVRLDGQPWSTLPESRRRPIRPRIGAIYQDPLGSFDPRMTVEEILADAASLGHSTRPAGYRKEIMGLLDAVGLPAATAGRRPARLSGGQRQRVAIARALAPRPDVLICDEPVSALDVLVQAQILDLLDDLQREFGLGYLFISHDLGVVRHVSDDVAVMTNGRIVEAGPTEQVLTAPSHPYTRRLLAAAPRLAGASARKELLP
ncbi:ABC transporter ATP-binding protein [Dactylosporangium sp. NPDC051485]|uniref:ABC transporter ATP-binding protein n=1 Tax=Dactylosporangium sp. NPDC051485 TaxID=3154846 RepID=UPI00343FC931